jgi:hypothetical protein
VPRIVETLQQTEWWYGEDGFPYRLDEMELTHLWNVVNWLTRRGKQLRRQHYWAEFLEFNGIEEGCHEVSVRLAFHEWLRGQRELESDPTVWLDGTPLVRALRRELLTRATTDGDVVGVHYDQELEDESGTDGRAVGTDPRLRDRPALG